MEAAKDDEATGQVSFVEQYNRLLFLVPTCASPRELGRQTAVPVERETCLPTLTHLRAGARASWIYYFLYNHGSVVSHSNSKDCPCKHRSCGPSTMNHVRANPALTVVCPWCPWMMAFRFTIAICRRPTCQYSVSPPVLAKFESVHHTPSFIVHDPGVAGEGRGVLHHELDLGPGLGRSAD